MRTLRITNKGVLPALRRRVYGDRYVGETVGEVDTSIAAGVGAAALGLSLLVNGLAIYGGYKLYQKFTGKK